MLGKAKKPLKIIPLEKRLMLDASLAAIAGQVLWLDSADSSTVIDADGDNAATGTGGSNNGFDGFVAEWRDKSSSGFHVTASGTERPQYGIDTQNGNGVITFDGSNDRLTSNDVVAGDDVTMFIVYNRTNDTGRDANFELGGGGSRNAAFLFANDTIQYYANSSFTTLGGTYAQNQYHLSSYIHDTNTISAWMNGTNVLNATTQMRATTTGITVGDDATSGDEMTGTIAEILVYDRDLTADERHDVETYLAGKWGLTIANTGPTLDTNTGTTLDQGTTTTITTAMLASSDVDNTDGNLVYTITDNVDYGTITNTNTATVLGLGDTFRQSDIDNGYITFTHDNSVNFADSFSFTVTDLADTTAAATFNFTINPIGTLSDLQAIPNPVFHYDAQDLDGDEDYSDQPATGTAIGTITNPSGTNAAATQSGGSRPIYDDDIFGYQKGGLVFDGNDDHLDIPNDILINDTGPWDEKSFAFVFRTGNDIVSNQIIYEQGGGSNGYNLGIWDGDLIAYVWGENHFPGGDQYKSINLGAVSANTTYSVIMIHNATGPTLNDRIFSANVNGGAFQTLTRVDVQGSHIGNIVIGRGDDTHDPRTDSDFSNGGDFDGAIGEMWNWNHALDTTQIAQVDGYFQNKWFDTPHSLDTNLTLNVSQDGVVNITNTNLDTNDTESPDTIITYTLTSLPAQGDLRLGVALLGINDTFTQDDINNGLLTFDHDGTAAPTADSFNFTVTDGYNTPTAATFNFNIIAASPTNPLLVTNIASTVNEGATDTITNAELSVSDPNTGDTGIIYTVTDVADFGTIYNNGIALGLSGTFTEQNIIDGLITYIHDATENFTDTFSFTVSDGSTTIGAYTYSFIITPVNDETPTAIGLSSTSVNENVANGTVIGTLSATDADLPGDTFTYSIQSDPDNKFTIFGN